MIQKRKFFLCLFSLMCLLLPLIAFAQYNSGEDIPYKELWKGYKKCDKEQVLSANGRLNVLQRKAEKDHDEYQLFKVVYHRTLLNNTHNSSWSYTHSLLYLDSMKKQLDFTNPSYNGLIDYMIAEILSEYRIQNYSKLQHADLGLTDFHTLDQWSQSEVENASVRYYEEAFSLLNQDSILKYSDFDFMYRDTSFYALLPCKNIGLYDVILLDMLYRNDCPATTKEKLLDQALKIHRLPKDLDIIVEYELQKAFNKFEDFTLPLDSNRHWMQLVALEAKYGEHYALTYTKGILCYGIAHFAKYQDPGILPKALSFFEETLQKSHSEYYNYNARYYQEQIKDKYIYLDINQDDFIPSARLMLPIGYKNIDTLYVTIIKTKTFRHAFYKRYGDNSLETEDLTGKGCLQVKRQRFDLSHSTPNTYHTTDLFLDSLPTGNYVLLFHTEPEWDTSNVMMTKSIKVTHVHLSINSLRYNRAVFTATDRQTGEPLRHKWLNLDHNLDVYTTDKHGQVQVKRYMAYWSLPPIDFYYNKSDKYSCYHSKSPLTSLRQLWRKKSYSPPSSFRELVLDRGIYRPGQLVHFKYICFEKGKTVPNRQIMAVLYGPKGQYKDTLRLVTNKFGSAASSFKLPANLIGEYKIGICEIGKNKVYYDYRYDYSGCQFFEVAEYKLPTFTVTLEDCTEEICQGDTLHIRGQVVSLAGAPLSDATVNIKLSFDNQYRSYTVYCDEKGCFEYPFITLKNTEFDKPRRFSELKGNPNDYELKVEALVTDVNGETQRAEKTYLIPEHALNIRFEGCISIDQCANSLIQWQIQVENVQQKVLSTPVYVTVTHLRQPTEYRECIFSTSYQQPTDPLYSEAEYKRYFPEYSFNPKVNDRDSWLVLDTVYQVCQTFDKNQLLQIPISDWPKGSYKVELKAYDSHHREETVVEHFDIYRTDQQVSGRFEPVWVELPNTVSLGDSMSVMVGTSLSDAVVLCEVYQGFKKIYTGQLRLDNEYKIIKVPSKKKGHYQVNVSVQVVKNGFLYTDEDQMELVHPPLPQMVPQGLEINLTHWNNKLEPGAQEHWQVQIKDTNSTATKTSELLSWMVDGSIYEISKERAFDGLPLMFSKFKFPAKARPIYGTLSVNSLNHTYVAQTRPSGDSHPYGNFFERYNRSFFQRFAYFEAYNTVSGRRVTPGRSVSSALSSLEGVSSVDGNMTAVRGNRSDGAVIIIDGVQQKLVGDIIPHEDPFTYKRIIAVGEESKGSVSMANSWESARNASVSSDFTFDKNIRFRSDFKETAFFYPQLESDTLGRVSIDFKLPDQYTRWNLYALAHAENGRSGWLTRKIESSRSLMIQSNAPRFLREADTMLFQIKITNLCDTVMDGKAVVRFFNMADDSPLDLLVRQKDSLQDFRCQAHGTQSVAWQIVVPKGVEAVGYHVLAQAGHYGDGEENALPVLPNRALMTETMHFFVPAQQDRTFTFRRFKQADSPTLEHYSFSMEACSNPVWNVMLSLPYLIRYRYECNEQIFSRIYANALAAHVIKLYPSVETLCNQWRNDTINHPLFSELDKNQQFKDILLEENPWLMEAKNERDQRKNIAALFEEERLERQVNAQLRKLLNRQLAQGGWDWYGCQQFSPFVTNHIVAGCGKLERMGIRIPEMHYAMKRAIAAMDKAQSQAFDRYCEEKAKYGKTYFPFSETDVQYLYARSFFDCDTQWLACPYVQNLIKWAVGSINQATYTRRAEVALFLFRIGRKQEAENIMEGLRQQAVRSDDLGMYWKSKESTFFYYYPWYEAPIERHALIMEAFYEISPVPEELAAMKQWLLMQKNQTHWSNTLATTNAVYAIMLGETAEQLQFSDTRISLGNAVFGSTNNQTSDGGNVFFRHTWVKDEITPELAEIKVETDSVHSTYGACYWQYFEEMDKVTAATNGLGIERKICHVIENGTGRRIEEVTAENPVRIGEKILVRLVVTTDRDLEYVHVKDLRAAAFEPINVHERNERVNGLSYVVSPRDAATNFFFKRLPTGTYVLEYELLATQKGVFSNGVTTVECMYAPEYRAQSDGSCVKVVE